MSKSRGKGSIVKRGMWKRLVSLALVFVLAGGLVPGLSGLFPQAEAAEWMEPYLETLVDWDVMQGDTSGNLNPDRRLTRAEFVVMINRAFGYTERGAMPFTDVPANAWYADDFNIAYNAGYFTGSTATTADPTGWVTREQAAVLLGRNLRLQGIPGVNSDFKDIQQVGNWSRGLVQECAELGIIQGYQDGTFRPKNIITRGQMACFLVRALGTLVHETGDQVVGGVYGNLTVNTSGVKLKDTVVTGNLYISGGLGLGNVELENVTVMGKIVVCGAGEAERGENSIVLRNVTAEGLEINSLTDKFVSVRSEGLTDIGSTTVRTSAYVEDVTDDGLGLRSITLDGEDGVKLQLAGNIKEVVNISPNSDLQVVQGVTDILTVDERATGSALTIANETTVRTLNLDVGTPVTGNGDVGKMNINAAGSTATMLPDTIYVRPGLDSNIHGEVMDSIAAEESSDDPRLLSGYPLARNLASTSADAVFSTNKRGTIYWAVSALLDGSLNEDELRSAAANKGKVLRCGTINVTASKTEMTVRLTGLTAEGSYYISAMLVDNRDKTSPVKVAAFTTTDESVPAFATGYPEALVYVGEDDEQIIQARVMTTKTCQLYYALLPQGSTAPTANALRSGAVTGNLGYGVISMRKNSPITIPRINSSYLQEKTTYDLYLWLNDADNNKSSAVRRIQVTTKDVTPPIIQHITPGDPLATSVPLTASMNEPGTIYWAVVKKGVSFYAPGIESPEDLVAKIQVETGTGALKKGSVNVPRADTDVRINITGLEPQTSYDLYYVAKDRDGNYNVYTGSLIPPMEIKTQDNEAPTVEQEFTHDGSDSAAQLTPYPDTSIRLVFSESVQGIVDSATATEPNDFMALYTAVRLARESGDSAAIAKAEEDLAAALRYHIKLYEKPVGSTQGTQVVERNAANEGDGADQVGDDWVIDYRKATVTLDNSGSGEMIITFPFNSDLSRSGLNLSSGVTYYFELQGIADTAVNPNMMVGTRGVTKLQDFTTIDAQMVFGLGTPNGTVKKADGTTESMQFDTYFRLTPVTAASVSKDTLYDLLFWSSTSMKFELYTRKVGDTEWEQIYKGGSTEATFQITTQSPTVGVSIARELRSDGETEKRSPNFETLNDAVDREYGIYVTELNGSKNRDEWSGSNYILRVTPVASTQGPLNVLAQPPLTPSSYDQHQTTELKVKEIGVPTTYSLPPISFQDKTPPTFTDGYPTFTPGDTATTVRLSLSRAGSYYYVIAPVGYIPTDVQLDATGAPITTTRLTASNWETLLPDTGDPFNGKNAPNVSMPTYDKIIDPKEYTGEGYVTGSGTNGGSFQTITLPNPETGEQLHANTDYVIYIVLQGQNTFSNVYALRFHTEDVVQPVLQVTVSNPSANVTADRISDIKWMMLVDGTESGVLAETLDWDGSYAKSKGYTDAQIDAWKTEYGALDKDGKVTISVLEAMSEAVYINNGRQCIGSVFDLFASQAQKDRAQRYISTASPSDGSIPQTGSVNTTMGFDQNCQNFMYKDSPNLEYWFIAMGKSPEGSGYAFASASGLFYPDNTPPQVLSVGTSVTNMGDLTDDPIEASRQGYSGRITITFSTDLWYRQTRPTRYLQVVDKPLTTTLGDGYISSGALVTAAGVSIDPQVPATSTTNPPCTTLILEFTGLTTGSQIAFSQNLSNFRGITGKQPLTLTMKLVKNDLGVYVPTYYITSGSDWGNPTIVPEP